MPYYYRLAAVALILLAAYSAFAQNGNNPSPHSTANGLLFGNGAILTGPNKPIPGQAVCNVNGTLQGCAGGGSAGCDGAVTLVNGVGLFVNSCVLANSTVCVGKDTTPTHFAFPVTFPQNAANGSITVTGNVNDTLWIICFN